MANDKSIEYLKSLSDKIWATKNARFSAYKRMKRCQVSAVIATAMSSANIVAVNMLCYIKHNHQPIVSADNATVISVILSVMALVLSLIVTLLKYSERKDNYHQCGVSLDELNQRIKIYFDEVADSTKQPSYDRAYQFLADYERILKRSNLNHNKFDNDYALYTDKKYSDKDGIGIRKKIIMWLRWNIFDVNFLYWLIAIVPTILIFGYIGWQMFIK